MTRVSTFGQHALTQAQMMRVQNRLETYQVQLSSGHKSQRYTGIAAESARLVNLENARARTDQYLESNNTLALRLQTMEQGVAQVFDIATELKTLLVNATNGENAADLPLNSTAQNLLNEVSRVLNVKQDERYLFAGSATSTAPVDLTDPDFSAPPGSYPSAADTSYFQGDSTRLTARVADDFDVTWGATADEAGFEQLIRALNLTATASTTPEVDTTRLQEALAVVNQAIDNIPVIRTRVAGVQASVEKVDSTLRDQALYVDETITNIKSVDIPLTVSKLSSDQVLLEASYMTLSRLSALTLADYLR